MIEWLLCVFCPFFFEALKNLFILLFIQRINLQRNQTAEKQYAENQVYRKIDAVQRRRRLLIMATYPVAPIISSPPDTPKAEPNLVDRDTVA